LGYRIYSSSHFSRQNQQMRLLASRKAEQTVTPAQTTAEPAPSRPFDAFISYKQDPDGQLAAILQRALHQFAKPWNRQQALRVARDSTTFSATESLPDEIRHALDQSEFLILLASPEAAAARWIRDEVRHWCETRGARNLLIVLAAGTLVWDITAKDFRHTDDYPLPPELKGRFAQEPLWIDLRWVRAEAVRPAAHSQRSAATGRAARLRARFRARIQRVPGPSLRDTRFQDAVATLAARIRGVSKDTLYSEDLRQHRRTLRLAWTVAVVLGLLFTVASLLAIFAVRQRNLTLTQSAELTLRFYSADMQLIQREWEAVPTQTGRVLELLDETAANPERGFEWGYWNKLCHQDDKTLRGHTERLTSVAMSADGNRIVTGSWDNTARIWERQSGQQLQVLRGHTNWVTAVAITRDGQRVLTGSDDGTARWWDAGNGQVLWELPGHELGVTAVAVSPDGALAATAARSEVIRVWDINTGRQLLRLGGHTNKINALAASTDGRWLLSASADGTACVWDFATGQVRLVLPGRLFVECNAVVMSTDGRFILTGYGDDTMKIWNFPAGDEVRTFTGHQLAVTGVAFAPDGQRVFSASNDRVLRIWETATGKLLRSLPGHTDGISGLALSADGQYLASASEDTTAKIWATRGDADELHLSDIFTTVEAAAVSADGRFAAVADYTGSVKLHDLSAGQVIQTFEGDSCFTISADGEQVALT
jgi:WD40 repeat protein